MNSLDNNSDVEEERRLCYVAVTRAKKKLWLVNAKRRTLYGMDSMNPPSRFINEISDEYIENTLNDVSNIQINGDMFDEDASYNIGDKVIHSVFGQGVIVGVDKTILSIAFPHPHGIKKLMKGHKSIRKVG